MNTKMVRYILCRMLGVEAALLLVPVLVAVIYQEKCGIVFLIPIGILCLLFWVAGRKRPEHGQIYGKEGMVIVALAWILCGPLFRDNTGNRNIPGWCTIGAIADCIFHYGLQNKPQHP